MGSGNWVNLWEAAREIEQRLTRLFSTDENGRRAYDDPASKRTGDPHGQGLHHFYEYFHADTGRGLGASHQTGWTALINRIYEKIQRG